MACFANRGVPARHDLYTRLKRKRVSLPRWRGDESEKSRRVRAKGLCSPQRDPEILGRDVVGVVRRWFVGDGEVAEGAVEEILSSETKQEEKREEGRDGSANSSRFFGSLHRIVFEPELHFRSLRAHRRW